MKKVYIVTSGEYSDYHINKVFSTFEKAKEFTEAFTKPSDDEYRYEYRIEEYELDSQDVALKNKGYSVWDVWMLKNGDTQKVKKAELEDIDQDLETWIRSTAGIPDVLRSAVWAKTGSHAVKIVNEKRVQMIANNEW